MHCSRRSRVLAVACAGFFSVSMVHAQVLRALTPVAGTDRNYARSVNDSGWVAGFSVQGGYETATLWTPSADTGDYVAQALPMLGGLEFGGANFITSNNLIGGYAQPADGESARAIVWRPSADGFDPTALPTAADALFTSAYAINAHGNAVGYAEDEFGNTLALHWVPDTSSGDYLGYFLPILTNHSSQAVAINRHNEIAGYTIRYSTLRGAVWRPDDDGGYAGSGVISADTALITALNDHGIGAGVYAGDLPLVMAHFEGDDYAFELPPYDGAGGASNSVNNFDVIVGTVKDITTTTPGFEAAAWLPTEGFWDFVNLDAWLNQTDPVLGAQWTLTDAWSISDTALVAGEGLFDADGPGGAAAVERAFVLNISSIVPASGIFGDFNHDASFTSADIDLLSMQIRSGQFHPLFDVNGDQQLDSLDLKYEVESILYTVFGDTDIDGDVDLSDLGNLATYYGMTSGALWRQGDHDGDGDVDLADLGLLAKNYDHGAAQAVIDFETLAALPDPAGTGLICVALCPLFRRARCAADNVR